MVEESNLGSSEVVSATTRKQSVCDATWHFLTITGIMHFNLYKIIRLHLFPQLDLIGEVKFNCLSVFLILGFMLRHRINA